MIPTIPSNARRLDLLRQITETENHLAGLYAALADETSAANGGDRKIGKRDLIFPTAIRIVGKWEKVTEGQLLSRARTKDIAEARFLAMWLVSFLGLPSTVIGRHFNRDHGIVLMARKRIRDLRDAYPQFLAKTEAMKAEFLTEMNAMGQMEMPLAAGN